MLGAWINQVNVWYANFSESTETVDENGDYTGEPTVSFGEVKKTRANLSPARGTFAEDIFGANLKYSKTMSTSHMDLGIDERTILWDEEPEVNQDGTPKDPLTAKYRVAAIARGHYHIHYALRQMNESEGVTDEND